MYVSWEIFCVGKCLAGERSSGLGSMEHALGEHGSSLPLIYSRGNWSLSALSARRMVRSLDCNDAPDVPHYRIPRVTRGRAAQIEASPQDTGAPAFQTWLCTWIWRGTHFDGVIITLGGCMSGNTPKIPVPDQLKKNVWALLSLRDTVPLLIRRNYWMIWAEKRLIYTAY